MPVEDAADRSEIAGALSRHKTFIGFSREQLDAAAAQMRFHRVDVGQIVITEGDADDDLFFIVKSGEYSARVKSRGAERVATYAAGGSFGELALRYGTPRKATVVCDAAGVLWALDRSAFQQLRNGHAAAAEAEAELGQLPRRSFEHLRASARARNSASTIEE